MPATQTLLFDMNTKQQFLAALKPVKGKTKYKRYVGSPLRYAGGKSLAVGTIVELIPEDTRRLVSPFMGGGAVEIACANAIGMKVIGYDVFEELMTYWDVQLSKPNELYKRMLEFKPTNEEYYRVKKIMKKQWDMTDGFGHWNAEKSKANGIKKMGKYELAATFYFSHNASYGPHFLGWPSSVYLDPVRYEKMILKSKNFKAPNIKTACMSFEKSIPKHNKDFLYCDPPYYLDGKSKMFIGMYPHRNFPIHHVGFDHEKLRDMLVKHKAGFILSYNDCPEIREMYKDFEMMFPKWQYTFGQGDTRIGKNRQNGNGSHIKQSHEIIIWHHPDN